MSDYFGNQDVSGTRDDTGDQGYVFGLHCVPSANGTLDQLEAYLKSTDGTAVHARMALYADGGSNSPGALLAKTTEVEFSNTTLAWIVFTGLSATPSISAGTTYWISIKQDSSKVAIHYQLVTAASDYRSRSYATDFDDPFGSSGHIDYQYCLRARTAPASGIVIPAVMHHRKLLGC